MKLMLVFALSAVVIASCWAAPQGNQDVQIISSEAENDIDGGYRFSYTQSDGTTRTEEAVVNNPGTENQFLTIRGSVSWVAPDGNTYTLNFVADDNGFQPEGEHIPK